MNGILPRAGTESASANEIYLIDNLRGAAPTNPTAISQQGVGIGEAAPDSTNISRIGVGASGAMRQTLTTYPTVKVKAIDAQATVGFYYDPNVSAGRRQATPRDRVRRFQATRASAQVGRISPVVGPSVPRFGVQRFDYGPSYADDSDYLGATIDFKRFTDFTAYTEGESGTISAAPYDDSDTPAAYSGSWYALDNAPIAEMADGTLVMAWIATTNGTTDYGLELRTMRPWVDTAWQHFKGYDNAGLNAILSGNLTPKLHCLGLFKVGEQVHMVLTANSGTSGVRSATFHVLQVVGTPDTPIASRGLRLVGDQVPFGVDMATSDCVAATSTSKGAIVAQSVVTNQLNGSDANLIAIARSADMRSWSGGARTFTATTGAFSAVSASKTFEISSSPLFPLVHAGDSITVRGLDAGHDKTWIVDGADGYTPTASSIKVVVDSGVTFANASGSGKTVTIIINSPAFETISDLRRVNVELEDGEEVTCVDFADDGSEYGIAVTNHGRIFETGETASVYGGTEASGSYWREVESPCRASSTYNQSYVPLYCCYVRSATTAYCGGANSIFIAKISGEWKVRWIDKVVVKPQFYDTEYHIGRWNVDFYGMAFQSDSVGWVVGQSGIVLYTSTGGFHGDENQVWKNIDPPQGSGAWYKVRCVPGSSNAIVVAGERLTNDRIMHIPDATISANTAYFKDVDLPSTEPIVGLQVISQTEIYAVDRAGNVLSQTSGSFSSPTYAVVATLSDCVATDLFVEPTPTFRIHVTGSRASTGGGMAWHASTPSSSLPPYRFNAERTQMSVVNSIYYLSSTVRIAVGTDFAYSKTAVDNRCYPTLCALPTGQIIMACCNLTRKVVEFYRADDATSPFFFMWEVSPPDSSMGDPWSAQSGVSIGSWVPRTCLYVDLFGTVNCQVGQEGYASVDNGTTWLTRRDGSLPFGLGALRPTSTYLDTDINKTRFSTAISDGRVLSTVLGPYNGATPYDHIAVWQARVWLAVNQTSGDRDRQFMPIAPGKAQWLGIDDLRVSFMGDPTPGDVWTMEPRYDFPAENLTVPSPLGASWRSAASPADIDMTWNRQSDDIVAALGTGGLWEVNGVALFRTNFRQARFRLSADGASSTSGEVTLDATILTSTTTANSSLTGVLFDSAQSWIPHAYKPGARTYYVQVGAAAYKVLDNTATTLTLGARTQTGVTTITSGQAYYLFGDRMAVLPSSLYSSTSRFGKWFHLKIASGQYTYEDYYTIGTIIAGTYQGHQPYASDFESRHRFSSGFHVKLSPSTVRQAGPTGVGSTRHFGRLSRSWTLDYDALQWHDRDLLLNGLLPELRQAFCFIPQGDDLFTAELVQLADGPDIVNVTQGADRYSVQIVLDEVQ